VLDDQHFEFLSVAFPAIARVGPGQPDDLSYTFPVAYQNAKAFGH
jgi:hypothetical protein